MGYRSILVHVDDSGHSDRRIGVAGRLAREYGASLQGMYLTSAREMTPFTAAMLPDAVVERRISDTGDAQAKAEARFRAGAAAESVATSSWSAPAGPPLDASVLHAYYADLAVVGQPPSELAQAGFDGELVERMLMDAGRPLLVVPHAGSFPVIGRNVIIAWKETRESARAVCDALPFLKRAASVAVMSVAARGNASVAASGSDNGIVAYLGRHDIVATIHRETADDIDVGNLLLSRAADLSADLIVMGAYSRVRLAERVFGGVTRMLLETMTVPVIMSH